MQLNLKRLLRYEVWAAVAIAIAMLFVVVGSFWFPGMGGSRISDLEEQLTSLQTAVGNKDTEIADLQSEVQNMTTQMDGLGSQIDAKDVELAVLRELIDVVTNRTYFESQMIELESQIEEKDSQISDLEEAVSTLEEENAILLEQVEGADLRVIGVYFNPIDGCEEQVLRWVENANESIHVLAYCFTLDPIGGALVEAHERGVEVKVVFEEAQLMPISEYERLDAAGIAVRTDTNPRAMHDTIMIVDGTVILTGSYDWTETAETFNDENLIILSSTHLASIYEQEFSRIWNQSQS